ncbi:MAG: CvpA family protein [Alphaproteobacteria bacterium]|nr:CvpA family protein [Alphaproteobacteria bacterium]
MEDLPFTVTDMIVLGGIALFGLLAAFWGFVGLVTGIGAWVGALAVTILGYPHAQAFAREQIEQELFADIAAGAGLFAGSLVLLMIVSSVLSHVAKESPLGSVNRALGFVAGLGVGYLVCCAVLVGSVLIFDEGSIPESVRESRSYELVRAGGVQILEALPQDVGGYILQKLEQGRQTVNTIEGLKDVMQPPVESGTSGGDAGYTPETNQGIQQVIDSSDNQ